MDNCNLDLDRQLVLRSNLEKSQGSRNDLLANDGLSLGIVDDVRRDDNVDKFIIANNNTNRRDV